MQATDDVSQDIGKTGGETLLRPLFQGDWGNP